MTDLAVETPSGVSHVSYSQLSSWVRCGKAYELERVIKVPSSPTWAMVAGKAVHTGTEYIDKGASDPIRDIWLDVFASTIEEEAERSSSDPEDWRATGRRTKDKPRGEDYRFWQLEGAKQLQRWKAWRLANKDLTIASLVTDGAAFDGIELPLVIRFGDVEVKGYVDRVFVTPQDELLVIDIKTGAYAPKDAGQQVGLYATGIHQTFGKRPALGAYWMGRTGTFSEPPKTLDHLGDRYWSQAMSLFSKAKADDIYLPNPGMFCGSCSVRDYCATQGGALAGLADSLSSDS